MTTRDVGNTGESQVCSYLQEQGYVIVDRNWRTKLCEIDIIVSKNAQLYFVEVKTRKNDHFGDGLDYITSKKLRQMNFAAQMWLTAHSWRGTVSIAAASVNNQTSEINFVELAD